MKLDDIDILRVGNGIQIVGAMFADGEQVFLMPLPDSLTDDQRWVLDHLLDDPTPEPDRSIVILDMDTEEWTRFIRQTDLLETEILQKAADGTLAKIILRKSGRQIDQGVSWRVFKRDGYKCRYCGADDVPLTVDHLVTWETGGPSIEDNLVSACRKCNKVRGNLPYAEWLQHPHYKGVSRRLDEGTRKANEALLATLDRIPLNPKIKSR